MCQYVFYSNFNQDSTLDKMINDIYRGNGYEPTSLSCYEHLKCKRSHHSSCLDWSEICDGKIDCLNDEVDEKDGWQPEIDECSEDESRCGNGQCIPQTFDSDFDLTADCID